MGHLEENRSYVNELMRIYESQKAMDKAIREARSNLRPIYRDLLPPLKGHWILNVYDGDITKDEYGRVVSGNRLVDQLDGYNLITTSGKGIILDRLYGLSSILAVVKLGVGTSNTAAAIGDTSLTGVDYGPAAFDSTPTRASLVVTSQQTYTTAQGNLTWAELGEFTAANSMLNRIAPIGPFTKSSAVSIVAIVQLTQS